MLRKVFRTGNSVVVSLPREALDYLDIQEGAEVEVNLDREKVAEFIERYRLALEKLAE
jgi:antitoxin component of MazEF toxin-antitoxin module